MRGRIKKYIVLLLILGILLSSCGTSKDNATNTEEAIIPTATKENVDEKEKNDLDKDINTTKEEPTKATSNDSISEVEESFESLGKVDVDKGIFNVTITLPKEYMEDETQESLDEIVEKKGYKSATLNDDGSVTFVMNKEQHNELLSTVKESIDEGIDEIVTSGEYPNISQIEHNDNYTKYKVTTSSNETNLYDSMMVLMLYTFGGMYNIYAGTKVDNIHVDYINVESGEVIDSADSKNLQAEDTSEE